MRIDLRLLGLLCLARLRAAGVAPWLLFAGWLVVARQQEPLLLRAYDIFLLDDAAWTGGVVLLVVLLLAEPRRVRRREQIADLVALVGVAVLQAAAGVALDRVGGPPVWSRHGMRTVWFVLAWAPLALTLSSSRASRWNRGRGSWSWIVPAAAFAVGALQSVSLRATGFTATNVLAWSAALSAALLWTAPRPQE